MVSKSRTDFDLNIKEGDEEFSQLRPAEIWITKKVKEKKNTKVGNAGTVGDH